MLAKSNKTIIGNHDYILAWRYIYGRYDKKLRQGFEWKYTVIPVSAFEEDPKSLLLMSDREVKSMNAVTARMRKHLGKWQSKERLVKLEELGDLKPIINIVNDKKEEKINEKKEEESGPETKSAS